MQKIDFKDEQALQTLVSANFSNWSQPVTVTQPLINDFAQLSGDNFWIHVDEERCKAQSPLKTTIAHGFLVLSLLSKMPTDNDILGKISGFTQMYNYGSNKLRFLTPVLSGSQIQSRNRVSNIDVTQHKTLVTFETQVTMVGSEDKPSLLYELILVLM